MSSIWSSAANSAGASPFTKAGAAPTPGGGAAAKFQSVLQSAGKSANGAPQLGLSPKAVAAGNSTSAASGTGSSTTPADSSDSGSTISANDFLTLLVTEMQNQDPTADVDPNAYIDQLVQINSLEQLISINQNLSEVLGAATSPVTPTTGGGSSVGTPSHVSPNASGAGAIAQTGGNGKGANSRFASNEAFSAGHPLGTVARGIRSASGLQSSSPAQAVAHGNLSLPKPSPASRTVAHALDGHARTGKPGHAIRDIPTRAIGP